MVDMAPSRRQFVSLLLAVLVGQVALGAEPFHYVAGKHGKGELSYVQGLPVLVVEGTPEQIGEQIGSLAAARRMLDYPDDLIKFFGADVGKPLLVKACIGMFNHFPATSRQELEAFVKSSRFEREKVVVANTMFDIKKLFGCSALLIDSSRSQTSGPLLGRNLDYPSLGYAQEYSLVTVYRPVGKHAFVSIGFPGLVGCLSGMNDAGLALGVLEAYAVKEQVKRFDPSGLPYALCYRRLLEECTTVEEAAKLLKSLPRTTITNLAICDKQGGAVFEVTPEHVVVRRGDKGVCCCTNHFCTDELKPAQPVNLYGSFVRFRRLETARDKEKIGIADVQARLHAANQGDHTLQTMIFEPATLKLHLAIGKCPSSAEPLRVLELKPLFRPE
jgi:hypothetical protein